MDNSQIEHLAAVYHDVFNSPAGIVVLDNLYTKFYDSPTKLPLTELDLAYAAGQRDVVRYITLYRDRKDRDAKAKSIEDQS